MTKHVQQDTPVPKADGKAFKVIRPAPDHTPPKDFEDYEEVRKVGFKSAKKFIKRRKKKRS